MDSSLHRREMSKRRKPSKARHRHAQYYETDQESVSRILDRKRRRTIPVTPGLSGRDSNEWVLEPSLTLDEDENLHRKQIDEKIRNSKGDKSAIIYRKMSDPARNFHSTDSESEDGFGATIELKNTILKTANSRSLRSRKNRSGVCLEKKEQEEIEHFIDELNPSGKRKKTNDVYCEDSQENLQPRNSIPRSFKNVSHSDDKIAFDSVSDYSVSRAPPADVHNGMEAVNNTNIPVDEGRKTTHVSASSNSSPPYDKWKNLMEDKKTKEEFTYKQTTKRFVLIVTTLFLSSAFLLFITLFFKDQT